MCWHVTASSLDKCVKVDFTIALNLKSTGIRRGIYAVYLSGVTQRAWDASILAVNNDTRFHSPPFFHTPGRDRTSESLVFPIANSMAGHIGWCDNYLLKLSVHHVFIGRRDYWSISGALIVKESFAVSPGVLVNRIWNGVIPSQIPQYLLPNNDNTATPAVRIPNDSTASSSLSHSLYPPIALSPTQTNLDRFMLFNIFKLKYGRRNQYKGKVTAYFPCVLITSSSLCDNLRDNRGQILSQMTFSRRIN